MHLVSASLFVHETIFAISHSLLQSSTSPYVLIIVLLCFKSTAYFARNLNNSDLLSSTLKNYFQLLCMFELSEM